MHSCAGLEVCMASSAGLEEGAGPWQSPIGTLSVSMPACGGETLLNEGRDLCQYLMNDEPAPSNPAHDDMGRHHGKAPSGHYQVKRMTGE